MRRRVQHYISSRLLRTTFILPMQEFSLKTNHIQGAKSSDIESSKRIHIPSRDQSIEAESA